MSADFPVAGPAAEEGVILFFLQPFRMMGAVFCGGVAGGGPPLFPGFRAFQGDDFAAFFLSHAD